jgi:hypothetical protein
LADNQRLAIVSSFYTFAIGVPWSPAAFQLAWSMRWSVTASRTVPPKSAKRSVDDR